MLEKLTQALPELNKLVSNTYELLNIIKIAPNSFDALLTAAMTEYQRVENLNSGVEARVCLLLDQFEEIFTSKAYSKTNREELSLIIDVFVGSELIWILGSMRSDFLNECSEQPLLQELMRGSGKFLLSPPNSSELRQMITQPTKAAGLKFEEKNGTSLRDVILEDAAGNIGVLPLLAFTMDELFHGSYKNQLTYSAYEEMGRLEGAISQKADKLVERLKEVVNVNAVLPRVFQLLVAVSPESDNKATSRYVAKSGLENDPKVVIEEMQKSHLVISTELKGEAFYRFSHEALISNWEYLKDWLSRDLSFLKWYDKTIKDAHLWSGSGGDTDLLIPEGVLLLNAVSWLNTRKEDMAADVIKFVSASLEKSRLSARHKQRIKRFTYAITTLVFIVLSIFSVNAFLDKKTLEKVNEKVLINESLRIQELASNQLKLGRPDTATLLMLNALPGDIGGTKRPTSLTSRSKLYDASIQWVTSIQREQHHNHGFIESKAGPEGKYFATLSRKQIKVWGIPTLVPINEILDVNDIYGFEFIDESSLVYFTEHSIIRWDFSTNTVLAKVENNSFNNCVQLASRANEIWLTSSNATLQIYSNELQLTAKDSLPDDSLCATPDTNGVNISIHRENNRFSFLKRNTSLTKTDFQAFESKGQLAHTGDVSWFTRSQNGTHFLSNALDNRTCVFSFITDALNCKENLGRILYAKFNRRGDKLLTVTFPDKIILSDTATMDSILELTVPSAAAAELSPNQEYIVVLTQSSKIELYSVATGSLLQTLIHSGEPSSVDFIGDRTVIITGRNGALSSRSFTGYRSRNVAILSDNKVFDSINGRVYFNRDGQTWMSVMGGAPEVTQINNLQTTNLLPTSSSSKLLLLKQGTQLTSVDLKSRDEITIIEDVQLKESKVFSIGDNVTIIKNGTATTYSIDSGQELHASKGKYWFFDGELYRLTEAGFITHSSDGVSFNEITDMDSWLKLKKLAGSLIEFPSKPGKYKFEFAQGSNLAFSTVQNSLSDNKKLLDTIAEIQLTQEGRDVSDTLQKALEHPAYIVGANKNRTRLLVWNGLTNILTLITPSKLVLDEVPSRVKLTSVPTNTIVSKNGAYVFSVGSTVFFNDNGGLAVNEHEHHEAINNIFLTADEHHIIIDSASQYTMLPFYKTAEELVESVFMQLPDSRECLSSPEYESFYIEPTDGGCYDSE